MASDAEVFTGSLPRVLCECPHLDVNIFTPTIFHNIWNQNIGFYIFCNRLLQDIYKAQKLKISVIKKVPKPNAKGLQLHTKATSTFGDEFRLSHKITKTERTKGKNCYNWISIVALR